jgi:hypothetical protein
MTSVVAVFGQLRTSQRLRVYTIFSASEINNTRRHPFGAELTKPTCNLYIATINSFISAAVGGHPHGELSNRTLEQHSASENCVYFFRNAAVTAISCLWTGRGRQGSTVRTRVR